MRDAFKEVLFFIGYSASNLGNLISAKTISDDENILKEEIDIKKYDPNNFFTFLDLFKLEEIGKKKEIGDKDFEVDRGAKYNLNFQGAILKAKNLKDLSKTLFFNKDYVVEEVIERLKKSDKKFQDAIKELQKSKDFTSNGGIDKFEEDFKKELYKIFNNIMDEAKNL